MSLIHKGIQIASNFITGDTLPIGSIMEWGSDTIPDNYLLANGQAVSRTLYSELFALWGTVFGEGDGTTTFNVPDRCGRVGVGKDASQTEFNTVGKTGGAKTHTLTVEQMPNHNHLFRTTTTSGTLNMSGTHLHATNITAYNATTGRANLTNVMQTTGNDEPHNNLQPYIVQNYIIKAKQSAGVVATVVDDLLSDSPTNALSAKQGRILNDEKFDKTGGTITGNVDVSGNITQNSNRVLDKRDLMYLLATAETNGDFKLDLDYDLEVGRIYYVMFPSATTSTSNARLSIDNGSNYYNLKSVYENQLLARNVENLYLTCYYNGTDLIIKDLPNRVTIWSGSWADNAQIELTENIYNFTSCIVRMDGQGTFITVPIYSNIATWFRGIGANTSNTPTPVTYQIGGTIDDAYHLTLVDCNSINHPASASHSTITNRTPTEIIGIR